MGRTGELVLIVDDEKDLRQLLDFNLKQAGYRTVHAASGDEALRRARSYRPDLIVLDLNLPDLEGTEVCRRLKADPDTHETPIVMLTARSSEQDRILGLELGAEDYVPKPFSVRELLLRIEVALRRRRTRSAGPHERILRAGPIELDTEAFTVLVGTEPVTLALLEFRLLRFLIEAEGRVRTREELLRHVWGYPLDSGSRTIETHVRRLRAKLGAAGDLIETVRSVGYRMSVTLAADERLPQR
jgi:two-component system phosphate regulon response regulator PhoB